MTWTNVSKPAVIAASLAVLAVPAPTAHADPDPISIAAYIHTLNVARVPYDDPGRVVGVGNSVCMQARGGTNFDAIHDSVIASGFTPAQAGYIMGAAVGTFCPDQDAALDRWSNSA